YEILHKLYIHHKQEELNLQKEAELNKKGEKIKEKHLNKLESQVSEPKSKIQDSPTSISDNNTKNNNIKDKHNSNTEDNNDNNTSDPRSDYEPTRGIQSLSCLENSVEMNKNGMMFDKKCRAFSKDLATPNFYKSRDLLCTPATLKNQ